MRIIGVIDLRGGHAVHAQGGCRHAYRPLERVGEVAVNGDAPTLARAYVNELAVPELYVADLDAIEGGAEHDREVRAIAACGAPVWLDAGVSTVAHAQRALARGASRVVVGLETLTGFGVLRQIVDAAGADRVAFSLDLRDSRPITWDGTRRDEGVEVIAGHAREAGATALIVLDLARIGAGRGVDLPLVGAIRRAAPDLLLLAGGGVRSVDDLRQMADAGCDGALIATALHAPGGADLVRAGGSLAPHQGYVTR